MEAEPIELILIIAFLVLSLGIHEAAHAFVAYRRGDTTAKDMGRLTLNPLAHIDPFFTIILPTILFLTSGFIFGGAKPVPVNPYRLRHPLRDMMYVALAGPISNFLLAIVFSFAWKIMVYPGGMNPGALAPSVMSASVFFNLLLAVFNMIPIPPLDGSRVMAYLLPSGLRETYVGLERFGMLIVIGLLLSGVLRTIIEKTIFPLYDFVTFLTGGAWVREDFTVQLDRVFRGPMDLLLHLVREQEVEIHEVEIHRVIEGYFEYMKRLEELDIEIAGDFLVMAATLMAIKSRSLLPRDEIDLDDDLDEKDELIERLIEYRRFKEAADDLDERRLDRALQADRGYEKEVKDLEPERTIDLGELTVWDLLTTFSRLMRETLSGHTVHMKGESRPLRWFVHELGRVIRVRRSLSLKELLVDLDGQPTREGMIGAFCALLELMQLQVVTADQEDEGGEIRVRLVDGAEEDFDSLIGASRFMDEEEPESANGADPPN